MAIDETPGLAAVCGDERKIKQVLYNLLSNALKFTPAGGTIHVEAQYLDGHVRCSVRDTGVGIDPADLEMIFEEFYQARSGIQDKTPGTGLGLALSRRFMRLHRGELYAASAGPGKGSVFTFDFVSLEEAWT